MFELAPDLLPPAALAVPLVLRPYQINDLARLRAQFRNGVRHVCYQAPTGAGKTVTFAEVVAGAIRLGNRVCILAHRDEIIQQISRALDVLGVAHALIVPGCDPATLEHPVTVASVQTLVRRLKHLTPPDLFVVDECHHAAAATWRKILAAFPQARVLGVTATPQRLDGKGLNDIFDALVIGPSVSELITGGYLSPFATFAPARGPDLSGIRTRAGDYATDELAVRMSKGVIITTAVDEYTRLCPGVPTIAYCVDIKHSELVAEAFRARGYRAAHLDGNTPIELRRSIIAALGTGELQVVTNCGLISEGLDIPGVVAVILLRPTKSLALYLQRVGRALRPAPGKKAFILDHAGNTFRFGPADAPQHWTLEGRKKKRPLPLQRCDHCGALVPLACLECPECGAVLREPPGLPGPHTHLERRGAALEALTSAELSIMSYGQCLRWAGRNANRLRQVAAARGYKPGWVWHRLQESQDVELEARLQQFRQQQTYVDPEDDDEFDEG
jgi:DNA repair protein RadD